MAIDGSQFGTGVRRFKRAKFDATVTVFKGGDFAFEKAAEVGEGGMLMQVEQEYRKGEIFEVTLFVSGKELHSIMAEVLYHLESGPKNFIGVRFLDSSGKLGPLQEEIKRYVAEVINEMQGI